jgi:ATP-dependent 26S proteasome regulatory subunit
VDRAAILRICTGRVPLAPDVDLENLAGQMEELTGADIESLCKKATLSAIVEFQQGTRFAPFVVMRRDFLACLDPDRSGPKHLNTTKEMGHGAGDFCPDAVSTTKH